MIRVAEAYPLLAKELSRVSQLSRIELVRLIEGERQSQVVELSGKLVEIEIGASWHSEDHSSVRIFGHAWGPSTLHHEHCEESLIVDLPACS